MKQKRSNNSQRTGRGYGINLTDATVEGTLLNGNILSENAALLLQAIPSTGALSFL